jgi:membrane protein required for colicin V production
VNLLDYALVILVAVSVITAAVQGFVYEIWMMAAALVALGVAVWQYGRVAGWLETVGWTGAAWGGPEARHFIGFVIVLAAVLLVAMICGRLLRRVVRAVGLSLPDRLLGAGLGLVRGLLLAIAVVAMLAAYPLSPRLLSHSRFAPRLLWGGDALAACVPAELSLRMDRGLAAVRRSLP